ncbi:MAG TPA: metalloregulator ArsR/SmtB family transcription factor [bacterium]|nr:metalloregulator ArsR/SmtB family transcription factor [bacterium]
MSRPSGHRSFKDELYAEFARIGQALASPKRLEMLDLLAQREWPVEELAREMDQTLANTSQHLQVLLRARLVEVRRQGTRAYYRLAGGDVYRLWQAIRELGEVRLAEVPAVVRRHLGERPDVQVLNVTELLRRVRAGDIILLDVRPVEEYRAGHLPGARPVPLAELTRTLKTLPKHRDLVVYCRGPYCVLSDEAVALLHRKGFRARRLALGFPDWQALRHSATS